MRSESFSDARREVSISHRI